MTSFFHHFKLLFFIDPQFFFPIHRFSLNNFTINSGLSHLMSQTQKHKALNLKDAMKFIIDRREFVNQLKIISMSAFPS